MILLDSVGGSPATTFEHKAFVARGATNNPVITIPDFDILAWSDDPVRVRFWLDSHASIHNALRAPVGLSGIDLSAVDFADAEQFDEWLSLHATEHSELRILYGIS